MILTLAIPVYNRIETFKYSLISAVEAFYKNKEVEILILDDGSKDDIEGVVRAIREIYKRQIIYHKNEANKGRLYTFNEIIKHSQGKFIWIIGSDDFININAGSHIVPILGKYSRTSIFVTSVGNYNIDLNQLEGFDQKKSLSDYLDFNILNENSSLRNGKLQSFLSHKSNNVYFGAVMATIFNKEIIKLKMEGNLIPYFETFRNWYPNTYYISKLLNEDAIHIDNQLVIAGDGKRDWNNDLSDKSIWNSDFVLIQYKVVRDLIDFHKLNGLRLSKYYLAQNQASEISGQLLFPILINKYVFKKYQVSLTELSYFKILISSILYPKFYLGVVKGLIKVMLNKI